MTIQASILKTLKELQEKFKVTILFIANNLSLISVFCDNVGILHKGRIIERFQLTNEKGIKVFGPRSFGFDSEYVSMGQILK